MDHDNIEVSDAGAERLARLADGLTDDQVDALLGAAAAREDGSISRREFATAAGALGVGSLLGGGGVGAMTETAAADASTTDGDWNVGSPNNRGDVFADGLDSKSVSTDDLDTITRVWSSWGRAYDVSNGDITQAITDLNNKTVGNSGQKFLVVPPGKYTTDTGYVATARSGVFGWPNGTQRDSVIIEATSSLSGPLVDIQGGAHYLQNVCFDGGGNISVVAEYNGGSNNNIPFVRYQNVTFRGHTGTYCYDLRGDHGMWDWDWQNVKIRGPTIIERPKRFSAWKTGIFPEGDISVPALEFRGGTEGPQWYETEIELGGLTSSSTASRLVYFNDDGSQFQRITYQGGYIAWNGTHINVGIEVGNTSTSGEIVGGKIGTRIRDKDDAGVNHVVLNSPNKSEFSSRFQSGAGTGYVLRDNNTGFTSAIFGPEDVAGLGTYVNAQSNSINPTAGDRWSVGLGIGQHGTKISAERGSDSASTTAGTWINAFDSESDDRRGEFNSSQEFVPVDDADYAFNGTVEFRGSTTGGDKVQVRLQDLTNGSTVQILEERTATDSTPIVPFSGRAEGLTAGDKYVVEARNANNDFVIYRGATQALITSPSDV